MSSTMWRKKKDSSDESSRTVERNYNLNDGIMECEAGFCCNDNQCYYSFLNCHLCHKSLRGKDTYMYRGEMGFCSEKCRNTQMYLDDMKKIEILTRRILVSFHERRRRRRRCETETRGVGGVVPAAAPPMFISK